MTVIVAFVSQKGGVGKSTLARALAREAAASELSVKVGDLDAAQATIIDWHKVRTERGIQPSISVELFASITEAIKAAAGRDLLVVDGPAKASASTTEIARKAQLIVQPTGSALDDLKPAVRVFHGLVKAGIPQDRLIFALNHISTDTEADFARVYVEEAGYKALPGYLPERAAYRIAQNEGYAVTETRFATLKGRADTLIQALIDKVAGDGAHG